MAEDTDSLTTEAFPVKALPDVIKGDADWREYRPLELSNGVKVVLVHDHHSKTTSAAATVDVGASSDPPGMEGLAHYCEHMCFLGSAKYPGENEYKKFLSQHGGRSNASTSMHLTTYKFEVLADHAEHTLDIFSQFFCDPLFTKSGAGREIQAVDSENSKNLTADVRRRLQILKALADPKHYYSKFTTGNAQTLPSQTDEQVQDLREALLTFHRLHYRPDKLTVVVAGPQSLDTLQEWVVPRFSTMTARPFPENPNAMTKLEETMATAAKDAPPYAFGTEPPPFNPAFRPELQGGKWPVLLTVKPLKFMRRLVIMFPLPSVRQDPDKSPLSILSHLLGHEGVNSSFAVLQNAGYIRSLSSGSRVSGPDQTLFQIDIGLTEEGEAHWKEVVDVILQHCRLIKNASREELARIWDESAKLHQIFFQTTSPGSVYGLAPGLSQSVLLSGTKKCMSAGNQLDESAETLPWDEVQDFCSRLQVNNCFIERCGSVAWDEMMSKTNGQDIRTEKWYDIEYMLSEIDQEDIDRWDGKEGCQPFFPNANLQLPTPNRYIPRTLELCVDLTEEAKMGPRIEKDIEPPNLLVETPEFGRLWHRLDDRYALPKSSLTFLVRNAATQNVKDADGVWRYDVYAMVHSSILQGVFSQAMAQETYDAHMAGLGFSLGLGQSGVTLSFSGFSDRLSDFAVNVMDNFFKGDFIDESLFIATKDRLVQSYKTALESGRADSHAVYYRDLLLAQTSDGPESKVAAAEVVTLDSLKKHHAALLQNSEFFIDCLYSGNVSESDAKHFFDSAQKLFTEQNVVKDVSKEMWIPSGIERRMDAGKEIQLHFASRNAHEENGATTVTYQSTIPGFRGHSPHPESLESTAAIQLICHMLREPLFNTLRTKQQLGYIVSSYYDLGISGRPGEDFELGPLTVPVEFIVINILSKKLSPPEVLQRIDEFLVDFKSKLAQMPESEIDHHAKALSTKLLKPPQKLSSESSIHFSKIQRFAPEVLANGRESEIPWDSVKTLAHKIGEVKRPALINTWERLTNPSSRARIVSCVYGKTHPWQQSFESDFSRSAIKVVDDIPALINIRKGLPTFDNTATPLPSFTQRLTSWIKSSPPSTALAVGSAAVALSAAGWAVFSRRKTAK